MFILIRRQLALATLTITLAGCFSGGPDSNDIKKIYDEKYKIAAKNPDNFWSAFDLANKNVKISHLECKEMTEMNGWICNYTIEQESGKTKEIVNQKLVKSNNKWKLI